MSSILINVISRVYSTISKPFKLEHFDILLSEIYDIEGSNCCFSVSFKKKNRRHAVVRRL